MEGVDRDGRKYSLTIPPDFDELPWEDKGYYPGLTLRIGDDIVLHPSVFDPVRLAQDIEMTTSNERSLAYPCMIIVKAVTRTEIEAAVASLAESAFYNLFQEIDFDESEI